MIKIAGGLYRSRIIEVPSSLEVPTKSIVRTAIGNALQRDLEGARVLDLFAGSGAVGIELLSRGASSAVFSDASPEAVSSIKNNLQTLKISGSDVLLGDYSMVLRSLGSKGDSFDIIFLDPPYKLLSAYAEAPKMIADLSLLKPHGILVIEYEGEVSLPDGYVSTKTYNYGRTFVSILRR